MAGLDLMAFARGAEAATRANQQDNAFQWQQAINDMNLRTGEERLAQSQQSFGLGLPIAQANAEDFMNQRLARIDNANWEAGLQKTLAAQAKGDPFATHALTLDAIRQRFNSIDPSTPLGQMQAAELRSMVAGRIVPQVRAENRLDQVKELLAAVGVSGGQAWEQQAQWTDPASVMDPVKIASAGGQPIYGAPDRNGRSQITAVRFAGRQYSPQDFANLQAVRSAPNGALTPVGNIGLESQQRQQQLAQLQAWVNQQNNLLGPTRRMVMTPDGQVQIIPLGNNEAAGAQLTPTAGAVPVAAAAAPAPSAETVALQQQLAQLQQQIAQMSQQQAAVAAPMTPTQAAMTPPANGAPAGAAFARPVPGRPVYPSPWATIK